MATNADLVTYTETGDVDTLALVAARAADTANRSRVAPTARPTQRATRYTQPVGSSGRIGDTNVTVSRFDGTRRTVTFLGMDGDLAVFTGINL